MVLLLTAIAVHAVYRPWWRYYYLHFAIPLAWIAGYAVGETIQTVSRLLAKSRFRFALPQTWKGIALCGLVALVLARSFGRLEGGIRNLRQREQVNASLVIAKMKENANRTRWVYADNAIYPFHARLLMPPELAVITPKRFWSAQISVEDIVSTCRQRQVDLLLLELTSFDQTWRDFLQTGYSVECQEAYRTLYIANTK